MLDDVQEYFNAKQARDPWDALKESGNRLVAYIAEHAPAQYREHAETVLRELPENASAEDVRRIARENGFSGYPLDQFVSEAQAAGVFGDTAADAAPVAQPSAAARRDLENWARGVGGYAVTDAHIRTLMGHVDAIVAAERNAESVTA